MNVDRRVSCVDINDGSKGKEASFFFFTMGALSGYVAIESRNMGHMEHQKKNTAKY